MKILWVSELNEGISGCRLFLDLDFAVETIESEMEKDGYEFKYKSTDSDGRDSFGLIFYKDGNSMKKAVWAFCWVEVEEGDKISNADFLLQIEENTKGIKGGRG